MASRRPRSPSKTFAPNMNACSRRECTSPSPRSRWGRLRQPCWTIRAGIWCSWRRKGRQSGMPQAPPFDHHASVEDLRSSDKERQNRAFQALLAVSREPVDWAYAVWDELLRTVVEGDNRQRSIAGQVLCNLAASDPKDRMIKDVKALLALTMDERFVTARHCLQSLWKVGVAGERQREALVKGLVLRFQECTVEKNGTLIRYDIWQPSGVFTIRWAMQSCEPRQS